MLLNLYIDVQKDAEGEYINTDVEGLHTGSSEDLARLLAHACKEEELLKPIMFKAIALVLYQDNNITDQDLNFYLEAIEEGEYEQVLDVLEYMEQ